VAEFLGSCVATAPRPRVPWKPSRFSPAVGAGPRARPVSRCRANLGGHAGPPLPAHTGPLIW